MYHIPKAKGQRVLVKHNVSAIETVQFCLDVAIPESTLAMKPVAKEIARNTHNSIETVCRKIWNATKEIKYHLDPTGVELVRSAPQSWADRKKGIDCEDFSVFTSSILCNLSIRHCLRIADYGDGWQHIYVVVNLPKGQELILDPVIKKYNVEELPYQKKKDFQVV